MIKRTTIIVGDIVMCQKNLKTLTLNFIKGSKWPVITFATDFLPGQNYIGLNKIILMEFLKRWWQNGFAKTEMQPAAEDRSVDLDDMWRPAHASSTLAHRFILEVFE